eukprot:156507-Pleurochrysis_carterae.AAC.1
MPAKRLSDIGAKVAGSTLSTGYGLRKRTPVRGLVVPADRLWAGSRSGVCQAVAAMRVAVIQNLGSGARSAPQVHMRRKCKMRRARI